MIFNYDQNHIDLKVVIRIHDLEDGSIWFDTSESISVAKDRLNNIDR